MKVIVHKGFICIQTIVLNLLYNFFFGKELLLLFSKDALQKTVNLNCNNITILLYFRSIKCSLCVMSKSDFFQMKYCYIFCYKPDHVSSDAHSAGQDDLYNVA